MIAGRQESLPSAQKCQLQLWMPDMKDFSQFLGLKTRDQCSSISIGRRLSLGISREHGV